MTAAVFYSLKWTGAGGKEEPHIRVLWPRVTRRPEPEDGSLSSCHDIPELKDSMKSSDLLKPSWLHVSQLKSQHVVVSEQKESQEQLHNIQKY